MSGTKFESEHIQRIIDSVCVTYPGWQGFSDPRFEEDEIEPKKTAMAGAGELISKAELERLIFSEGNFDEVIERIEKVGRKTNLLFLGVPKGGDLNVLDRPDLNKIDFCRAVFDLLYSSDSSPARLERYLSFVQANDLPNKWTFPTYLLFMFFPETEMFIKPTSMKDFLELIGMAGVWSSKPSREAYSAILQVVDDLMVALDPYGPRDMVDIQSLIWVVSQARSKEVLTKAKRAEFTRLYQEFVKTYLYSKAGQEHTAFYEKGREQARQNLDEITKAVEQGLDITDAVLLKLLPYSNTKGNRERGAWIHIAPAITKDLKDWYQKAGRTDPENWPRIAQAILDFIQRCVADPSNLSEACAEFSALSYSKGFQTGMLTPIISALRPDDYVLINNKSRNVVNYFAGTAYGQNLIYYPKINTKARSIIAEVGDVLREPGVENVNEAYLFDMFSHWLVAVKKYFRPKVVEMASPFSEMFANIEEADWAFDLLKDTADRLGVSGAEDPLAAFTLKKRSGDFLIRLNYGHWLVHDFAGRSKSLKSMTIAIFQEEVDLPTLSKDVFAHAKGEPEVFLYTFPINAIRPFEGDIRKKYEETLDYIANKFKGWKKTPYHDRANQEVAEAVFDLEKRAQLLSKGISFVLKDEETTRETQYWRVACDMSSPQWPKWRDEGFISIDWDDLGDLSGISRDEFEARRDEAIAHHPDRTEDEYEQVWQFAHIQEGDQIVAHHEASKILGIGTVVGPSYFVKDVEHGHRIPVHWDDTALRDINEPGWKQTLVNITKEELERIQSFPVEQQIKNNPEYSLAQCAHETGFGISKLQSWVKAIERKGQAILYGPPGTGKTYLAERLARHLIGGGDGFFETVQFHPAYAYEDFIQGIRPRTRADGGLEYPMIPGRFLKFCEHASERNGCCILIIDEINRANLSRVFGELMYLLEYRDNSINLAGGDLFKIPSNVRIIGTMNTADRSIALVDHALRRRFAFLELYPDMKVLRQFHEVTGFAVEGLVEVLEKLNHRIENPHYAVGISYFLRSDLPEQIEDIWTMEIEPYLNEYFFDNLDWAGDFSWAKVKTTILP